MTSTATIQIHIEDKNDNVPLLKENTVSVCQSDEVSSTEITAYDPDGDPYSGPFSFEVIGDHKDKWSFDPSHGKQNLPIFTVSFLDDDRNHSVLNIWLVFY